MGNSIRDNLSKTDIINEIRLTLSTGKDLIVFLVEGKDDIDFMNLFINKDVLVRESYSGKKGVAEILEFFQTNSSVIGICDRDYDNNPKEGIFYYDFSCLETMLLSNPSVYDHVSKVINVNSFTTEEILKKLLVLSLARKVNYEASLGINFNGIRIILNDDYCINYSCIIDILKRSNPEIPNICELLQCNSIDNCVEEYSVEDLLYITQGHDLFSLLQRIHEKKSQYKSDLLAEKAIKKCIFSGYRFSEFSMTSLYQEITRYFANIRMYPWISDGVLN